MPTACARHILVKTKAEAEKIKQQIARGADFGEMAKKHSTCSSAKQGGNLGEFGPGQMVKAFDQVVFKKPVKVKSLSCELPESKAGYRYYFNIRKGYCLYVFYDDKGANRMTVYGY